jgi:hypothetical protein
LIFTIGTTLQNFVIVDLEMLEQTMQLAGNTPAEAEDSAPGFLLGFRIVGTLFIIGNALGMLALTGDPGSSGWRSSSIWARPQVS